MGLRYTQFHTTALCSPTRSCLLTGRNHHMNGMASVAEISTGYPGSNAHIPFENALVSEILSERGWNTYAVGKWHLCPIDEWTMASTNRNWPSGAALSATTVISVAKPISGTPTSSRINIT